MDTKKMLIYGGGGLAAVAAILYLMRDKDQIIMMGGDNVASASPTQLPDFVSNIDVNVRPDTWHGLSQEFMPLFGFVAVGVTNIGQDGIRGQEQVPVQAQTQIVQTPTQVSQAVAIVVASQKPKAPPAIAVRPDYANDVFYSRNKPSNVLTFLADQKKTQDKISSQAFKMHNSVSAFQQPAFNAFRFNRR